MVNHVELRRRAQRNVPGFAFDYLDGGAGGDGGMAHNRAVLDGHRLVPRYGVAVAGLDTGVTLFGRRWQRPYGVAPTGLANLVWPGADLALARHAAAHGIPYVASTPASTALEELALACGEHLWFQLYVCKDPGITADLVARARNAQVTTLVVTLDTPVSGRRERNLRNGFTLPLRLSAKGWTEILLHPRWALATLRAGAPRFANLERYAPRGLSRADIATFVSNTLSVACTWQELESVRRLWPGTLLAKGVLDPRDAERAQAIGCDGVVLSNHGGRQLEAAVSPLETIGEVRLRTVRKAGPKFAILLDSGIRSGSDVVKSLALGAEMVLLGRLGLYGMGAAGAVGVGHAFGLVDAELANTLSQIGRPRAEELWSPLGEGDAVCRAPESTRQPVAPPLSL